MSNDLSLFEKSKQYEYNKILLQNNNNPSICDGIGVNCKQDAKIIIIYLMIVFIAIIATISLIMNIVYSVNQNKSKNVDDSDVKYIKNTDIKYNEYGNLFVPYIIYE